MIMAQAIHEQLNDTTSAIDAAAKVVEILAIQSKAVLVSILLPSQLWTDPICEAGYGSLWAGNLEDIDLERCEREEIPSGTPAARDFLGPQMEAGGGSWTLGQRVGAPGGLDKRHEPMGGFREFPQLYAERLRWPSEVQPRSRRCVAA